MNKLILITFLLMGVLFAQNEEIEPVFGWKKQMVGDLNFTQNAFSKNWGQGGENSWSWAMNINAKFEKDEATYNWANSAKFAFGQASIGDSTPRKAADELALETVYTYKWASDLNPYAAATLHTQLTEGFQYNETGKTAISNFFDPGYITESLGMSFKPNDIIKTRLGLAAKQTITSKYSETYGNGEEFRKEIGSESVTDLHLKLNEQILYESKLELFSNLKAINQVDANWDNTFSATVSELIKVSFNFRMVYDKDISIKRQLKQTLAVGLSYTFL